MWWMIMTIVMWGKGLWPWWRWLRWWWMMNKWWNKPWEQWREEHWRGIQNRWRKALKGHLKVEIERNLIKRERQWNPQIAFTWEMTRISVSVSLFGPSQSPLLPPSPKYVKFTIANVLWKIPVVLRDLAKKKFCQFQRKWGRFCGKKATAVWCKDPPWSDTKSQ